MDLVDPQVAVTPDKIDSSLSRMGRSGGPQPRRLYGQSPALYKLGGVDTLWGYHSVTENDTIGDLRITYGFGELGYDEETLEEFDLLERDDTLRIDAQHPANYFMQSVNFTLPASATFQWCPWVNVSHDSLYRSRFDTLRFALQFYDTAGVYRFTIDSVQITDSALAVPSDLREVTLDRDSNQRGYVVFTRTTGTLGTSGKQKSSIISTTRFSSSSAFKRAGRNNRQPGEPAIEVQIEPNPTTGEMAVSIDIPERGPVTVTVFDQLGRQVGSILNDYSMSPGKHKIHWNFGVLPAGLYYLRSSYGNDVVTNRVIHAR